MDAADGTSIVLGSTTVGLLIKEFFAWRRSRSQKTEITPNPLNVKKEDKYVTRGEFNKAMERNDADHKRMADEAAADHERMERENSSAHENIFNRLTRNDREYGEIKGLLTGVANDLQLIKGKLFKTR